MPEEEEKDEEEEIFVSSSRWTQADNSVLTVGPGHELDWAGECASLIRVSAQEEERWKRSVRVQPLP
jgi:hypothetical protein